MNLATNNTNNSETHLTKEKQLGLPIAGNEVSDEIEPDPDPFDADTPDVSQHENYPWSDRDLLTLHSHLEYFHEMQIFVSLAIRDGPYLKMPKPPKPTLKSVFVKPKPKPILLGVELHDYLIKHLVDNANIKVDPWNPISLDNVKNTLQAGFHIMKQHQAGLLSHYLHFGIILNHASNYFSICKLRGDVNPHDLTWAKWLKDNVGISISYSKQLRSIAKEFGAYQGLYCLGISFSEFLKKKEHIKLMFAEFPELDQFWRNNQP